MFAGKRCQCCAYIPGGGDTPIDDSTRTLGRVGCHFGQLQCASEGRGFAVPS